MKTKQFVILGLGIFGSTLAKNITRFGHEVLAIDKDPACVQRVSEFCTKAVIGDVTDKEFLVGLGVEEFDVGVVCIGDELEGSLLAVLNLKEIGVPYVVAKAKNKRYEEVLSRVGADEVINPEKEMGIRVARQLVRNNIQDLIPLDEDNSIVEMKVPHDWAGKSLIDLNLREKYGINVIGKRDEATGKLCLTLDPTTPLEENDIYLMIANTNRIEAFDYTK